VSNKLRDGETKRLSDEDVNVDVDGEKNVPCPGSITNVNFDFAYFLTTTCQDFSDN